jgi:hypothetical protein
MYYYYLKAPAILLLPLIVAFVIDPKTLFTASTKVTLGQCVALFSGKTIVFRGPN